MSRKAGLKRDERPRAAPGVAPLPSLAREFGQVLLSYGLTLLAFSWIFPANGVWPLTFVCLVPWTVGTCITRRAWLVHWLSFFLGWGFFLINLRWLMPVTGLGYAALGFYLALYWPVAAWALRTGQRHRISPLWTLPVAWVACEYLRAWVMSGFPWLFLAHALYAQTRLIQISDLTGAYGISFLAALINGVIAAWVIQRLRRAECATRWRQLVIGTIATAGLLVGVLIYGRWRCGQTDFETGPRIAVVQHDFPLHSEPPYGDQPLQVIFAEYLRVAADAAAQKPDLLVFPETVWGSYQNIDFLSVEHNAVDDVPVSAWTYGRLCHEAISAFARGDYAAVNRKLAEIERTFVGPRLPRLPDAGGPPVTVVLGAQSVETFPGATYPKSKRYNSALVYDPDGAQRPLRYDKNHLVPFGEVVPFRYGKLHWLYRLLNKLSPFSENGKFEYSLSPGHKLTVFALQTKAGETRFGTPICYEDVMPGVVRRYVWDHGQRRLDFLINISNDAWFLYGHELPQHLAICAFRAVENRVGIARAVNTGISGFIDPNGRLYSLVERDGRSFGRGIVGYQVAPVYLDRRGSFYGRTGDWFAGTCLALTMALWAVAVAERWVLAIQQRLAAWRGKGAKRNVPPA